MAARSARHNRSPQRPGSPAAIACHASGQTDGHTGGDTRDHTAGCTCARTRYQAPASATVSIKLEIFPKTHTYGAFCHIIPLINPCPD
jgi:hypothetical protein